MMSRLTDAIEMASYVHLGLGLNANFCTVD